MRWPWSGGGHTGKGRSNEVAGIVHPPYLVLPQADFDRLGEARIRELFGADVEVTIVDEPA